MKSLNWAGKTAALLKKDLVSEFRTRASINALLLFALVTLITVGIAFSNIRLDAYLHSALLWIIIYFSAQTGLAGCFVKEEDSKTALALRFYAQSSVVLFGKMFYSMILLMVLVVILFPLYYILMNLQVDNLAVLILVLFLGVLGLSVSGTVTAVMVSRSGKRGALFGVLSFPIMLPVLLMAINAGAICIGGGDMHSLWDSIKILIGYPVILTAISYLLFDYVWRG